MHFSRSLFEKWHTENVNFETRKSTHKITGQIAVLLYNGETASL